MEDFQSTVSRTHAPAVITTDTPPQVEISTNSHTVTSATVSEEMDCTQAEPTLEDMCRRKPTRPSLFVPPLKRHKLAAILKKNKH